MQANNIFNFNNFKVPAISGGIGFVLIFFINMIVGNSFFVIFTRSLLYGVIVFSVFLGVIILFKNYLSVDSEEREVAEEKAKPNIDITVDDQVFDDKTGKEINLDLDDEFVKDDEAIFAGESLEEEPGDIESNAAKTENKNAADSKSSFKNEDIDEIVNLREQNIPEAGTKESEEVKEEVDSSDLSSDSADSFFNLNEDKAGEPVGSDKDLDAEKSIKSKIGINVSFEEVAKAIRTKIKEE